MPGLPVVALLALLVGSAVGGIIQGVIGFGFALVAVPMLALLRPEAVPVTVMCMAIPMSTLMGLRERGHIDVRGFGAIMAGRVVGIGAGVTLLSVLDENALSVLVGSMILLGVALSLGGLDIEPRLWLNAGAGVLSGVMGATSGIGGPALAVVYQNRPGPELRSTLAVSYLAGIVLALAALTALGHVHGWQVTLALTLLPGLLLGLWVSGRLVPLLEHGWLRPTVLAFAAIAGVTIVLRGLF